MKTSLLEQVRQMDTLGGAWRVILENGRSSPSTDTRREIEEFATTAEKRTGGLSFGLYLHRFTHKSYHSLKSTLSYFTGAGCPVLDVFQGRGSWVWSASNPSVDL
jgi:hypothetical protein